MKKNLPQVLTKQLFLHILLSSVKTSGRFFQIFVAFSEKLDFIFVDCPVFICLSETSWILTTMREKEEEEKSHDCHRFAVNDRV